MIFPSEHTERLYYYRYAFTDIDIDIYNYNQKYNWYSYLSLKRVLYRTSGHQRPPAKVIPFWNSESMGWTKAIWK